MKNKFTTVKKYCYFFFFDLQLNGLIQNEQNNATSKHFTKPVVYIRTIKTLKNKFTTVKNIVIFSLINN